MILLTFICNAADYSPPDYSPMCQSPGEYTSQPSQPTFDDLRVQKRLAAPKVWWLRVERTISNEHNSAIADLRIQMHHLLGFITYIETAGYSEKDPNYLQMFTLFSTGNTLLESASWSNVEYSRLQELIQFRDRLKSAVQDTYKIYNSDPRKKGLTLWYLKEKYR